MKLIEVLNLDQSEAMQKEDWIALKHKGWVIDPPMRATLLATVHTDYVLSFYEATGLNITLYKIKEHPILGTCITMNSK